MSVAGQQLQILTKFDYRYSGAGQIDSATLGAPTQIENVNAPLRVSIYESSTLTRAFFVVSNLDGSWSIPNVMMDLRFLAIVQDANGVLNAGILDNIFAAAPSP